MTATPPALSNIRKLKRIAPLQLGKILGVLYGIMALLMVPIFLVMSLFSTQLPEGQRAGMFAFGVGFALFMPVIYAVMGFVFGVLSAWLYNLVAKWVGGIEVEVE